MRLIHAWYNMYNNCIDITAYDNYYILRIDCSKAEENLITTSGSQCTLNALAIDDPIEYARLHLNNEMQEWITTIDTLDSIKLIALLA